RDGHARGGGGDRVRGGAPPACPASFGRGRPSHSEPWDRARAPPPRRPLPRAHRRAGRPERRPGGDPWRAVVRVRRGAAPGHDGGDETAALQGAHGARCLSCRTLTPAGAGDRTRLPLAADGPLTNACCIGGTWTLLRPLTVFLVVCAAAFAFLKVASEVREGETQRLDERVLRSLRTPADPAIPIGPGWLLPAAQSLTALGSVAVLL